MSEQNKPQIHWLQLNNRKRPEFVEIKDSEFIKSGEKNDFPYYLIDLYRRCSFHSAIINAKVNYIAGAGWDYAKSAYMTVAQKSLADKLIRQPFADTDLNESTLRWALDFEVHNMFAILVKWSKNKRTATLEHIDVANLRTNADMSKFAYTRKWYIPVTQKNQAELNTWWRMKATKSKWIRKEDKEEDFLPLNSLLLSKNPYDNSYIYCASEDSFRLTYTSYKKITLEQFRQITNPNGWS